MSLNSNQRRQNLKIAIDSSVEGETITYAELMVLWGVSKGRLVNIIKTIPWWPDSVGMGANSTLLWPRTASLEALLKWETKDDAIEAERAERMAKLLGASSAVPELGRIPLSELQRANALMQDRDERMVRQGQLVERGQVQHTIGKVFELLSRNLSTLPSIADPNGKLPPDVRERLRKAGGDLLLQIRAQLRDMLAGDDVDDTRRAGKAGGRSNRSGGPALPGGSAGRRPRAARPSAAARRDRDD